MKTQKDAPVKVLDQLDAAPLRLAEDFGFGYSAANCSGCGGGSCSSCGGGCYGCYTPSKRPIEKPYVARPKLLK